MIDLNIWVKASISTLAVCANIATIGSFFYRPEKDMEANKSSSLTNEMEHEKRIRALKRTKLLRKLLPFTIAFGIFSGLLYVEINQGGEKGSGNIYIDGGEFIINLPPTENGSNETEYNGITPAQTASPSPSPSPSPTLQLNRPPISVIVAEANELFSKVWDEWTGYNAVNLSEQNYYVDDGDLVWIIDRSECWAEYYYIDGKVRFALIKEDKYSTEAIRLYFYDDELVRLINLEKEYIHEDDDSEEFEEVKIYASKAANVYSDAMSYLQRFEPEVLE